MDKKSSTLAHGLEEYPKSTIIFGNLMMLLWIALGTLASWFFSPVAGWIYLILAISTVYVLMRKLVCTNCYYYGKWCAAGWGKLASLIFKQGNIEKFAISLGVKLAPIAYGLLSLIPLVLVIMSIIQKFTFVKLFVAVLLLAISAYSGGISRGKACVNCRMRIICPGAPKTQGKS